MAYLNRNRTWKSIPYTGQEREELRQMEADEQARFAEMEAEAEAIRAALHPAFAKIAQHIVNQANDECPGFATDWPVSNDECIAFVLEQVTKISRNKPEVVKVELRTIYADIRDRGGDAYAEHKARLQALNS